MNLRVLFKFLKVFVNMYGLIDCVYWLIIIIFVIRNEMNGENFDFNDSIEI